MEQQIEPEQPSSAPSVEEKNDGKSSTGIAVLFGVGLAIAFAVGLVTGFVMRPMAIKDVPVQVVVTVVPPPVQEVAQAPTPTVAPTNDLTEETPPTPEPTEDPNATPTPSIMEFVLEDARHFQGSEDAPITLVEFSDFK